AAAHRCDGHAGLAADHAARDIRRSAGLARMLEVAAAAVVSAVAVVFFAKRQAFIQARQADHRVFRNGGGGSGLRPLNRRDAAIAAWAAIALGVACAVVLWVAAVRDVLV